MKPTTHRLLSRTVTTVLAALSLLTASASAQLAVTVSPPKVLGQKAVVQLGLKNTFTENIESARAALFLVDSQGKVLGQATQWIIGGSKDRPTLAAGTTNVFNFVVSTSKPITATNPTVKVTFSRLVLEGGKLADPARQVSLTLEISK